MKSSDLVAANSIYSSVAGTDIPLQSVLKEYSLYETGGSKEVLFSALLDANPSFTESGLSAIYGIFESALGRAPTPAELTQYAPLVDNGSAAGITSVTEQVLLTMPNNGDDPGLLKEIGGDLLTYLHRPPTTKELLTNYASVKREIWSVCGTTKLLSFGQTADNCYMSNLTTCLLTVDYANYIGSDFPDAQLGFDWCYEYCSGANLTSYGDPCHPWPGY
jgi:hypothetical protein